MSAASRSRKGSRRLFASDSPPHASMKPSERSTIRSSGSRTISCSSSADRTTTFSLLRPRCKKLTDFADQLAPFFVDPTSYDAEGVRKHLSAPEAVGHLQALRDAFSATPEWSEVALEKCLRELAEARSAKAATLIHGTRLAMTGRMVSPGLFEMLVLLGRETVLPRLDRLAGRL